MNDRKEKCMQKLWLVTPNERENLEDLSVDGRILLIFSVKTEWLWTGFIWFRVGTSSGLL
jgi:hypothetical protein